MSDSYEFATHTSPDPWLRTFSRGCEGLLDHRNNLNGAVHHGQMRARLRESLERFHALAFQQTVAVHETGVIPDALFLDLPGFANLWVANYYSARNPLRLSSLVILGVVARMFRCATRSSCWCT